VDLIFGFLNVEEIVKRNGSLDDHVAVLEVKSINQ